MGYFGEGWFRWLVVGALRIKIGNGRDTRFWLVRWSTPSIDFSSFIFCHLACRKWYFRYGGVGEWGLMLEIPLEKMIVLMEKWIIDKFVVLFNRLVSWTPRLHGFLHKWECMFTVNSNYFYLCISVWKGCGIFIHCQKWFAFSWQLLRGRLPTRRILISRDIFDLLYEPFCGWCAEHPWSSSFYKEFVCWVHLVRNL